jgi:hypothetical protein
LSADADLICEVAVYESGNGGGVFAEGAVWQAEGNRVGLALCREPNPLFSHHRVPINNLHLNSSAILSNTITPPRGPIDEKGTPSLTKTTMFANPSTRQKPGPLC